MAWFLLSNPVMDTLKQTAPDKIEIRLGGGRASLIGLPFLAAGVCLVLIGLGVIEVNNASEASGWALSFVVLMGLVFAAVGSWLFLGRSWIILDKTYGTVTLRRGLIVPMKVEKRRFYEFDAVVLRFTSGDSDSSDRFPVALHPSVGGRDYPLCETAEYSASRANAEQIAGLIGFPLKDATTDHATVLETAQFEASFRQRTRSEEVASVAQPREMRSQVEMTADGLTIWIPAPRHPATLLLLIVPVGVFWWAYSEVVPFFERSNTPEIVQWFALTFAGLFALFPALGKISAVLRPDRFGTRISAMASGITIEERKGRKAKTITIAADDILDVDYNTREGSMRMAQENAVARGFSRNRIPGSTQDMPSWVKWLSGKIPSKGITVKSRTGFHVFAAGLPDAEVEFIQSIVKKALLGT